MANVHTMMMLEWHAEVVSLKLFHDCCMIDVMVRACMQVCESM